MEYSISDQLKASLDKELEGKTPRSKKAIFGKIANSCFPGAQTIALKFNDKVELWNT